MALIITAQNEAKLIISGTTTELVSIYSRIEFSLNKDGASMGSALYNYSAKTDYEANVSALLKISNFALSYPIEIDVATEEQSLLIGHQKVQTQIEALGYSVAIVDLT